jgi:putative membrane protein
MPDAPPTTPFDARQITRPDKSLLTYYLLVALCSLFGFPFVALPLYFKYETLRYTFDDEGVSMSWGILFRREIYLTYRRIQDIHLTRNIIQRWMGLATVSIQTASGKATPEMSIEGVLRAEELRDFLYAKMRGVKGDPLAADGHAVSSEEQALALLRQIRDHLAVVASKPEASN